MTGVLVCAWVIGTVGVVWGLWVRLLGLLCAASAAGLAWYILTNPIVRQ